MMYNMVFLRIDYGVFGRMGCLWVGSECSGVEFGISGSDWRVCWDQEDIFNWCGSLIGFYFIR